MARVRASWEAAPCFSRTRTHLLPMDTIPSRSWRGAHEQPHWQGPGPACHHRAMVHLPCLHLAPYHRQQPSLELEKRRSSHTLRAQISPHHRFPTPEPAPGSFPGPHPILELKQRSGACTGPGSSPYHRVRKHHSYSAIWENMEGKKAPGTSRAAPLVQWVERWRGVVRCQTSGTCCQGPSGHRHR